MPPTIETDRLTLRPFESDDALALHAAVFGDADAMKYLPGGIPRTVEQTQRVIDYYIDHWDHFNYGVWAVMHRDDNKLIGQAGLNFVPEVQQIEVLYAIGKEYWGKEYALEAAKAACRYAFYTINETKLVGLAAPENKRSVRVLEKLGFERRREVKLWKMKLGMYALIPGKLKVGNAAFTLINPAD